MAALKLDIRSDMLPMAVIHKPKETYKIERSPNMVIKYMYIFYTLNQTVHVYLYTHVYNIT